jgi:Na+/H+ antiporter NhaD/arsenite permease-like protein
VYNYLGVIDWNVIMMIAGAMGVVALFIESKMPSKLADIILDKVPNVQWAMVWLALFAGIISAFVDNVATVLMVAPVALNISRKLKVSPVPSIIAIAISSNLQGAATLVGDTTSILLGGEANMNFLDFFWYQSRPSIFWLVRRLEETLPP